MEGGRREGVIRNRMRRVGHFFWNFFYRNTVQRLFCIVTHCDLPSSHKISGVRMHRSGTFCTGFYGTAKLLLIFRVAAALTPVIIRGAGRVYPVDRIKYAQAVLRPVLLH